MQIARRVITGLVRKGGKNVEEERAAWWWQWWLWRWVLTLRETRDFDELDVSNYEKLEKKEEKRIYDYNVKNI